MRTNTDGVAAATRSASPRLIVSALLALLVAATLMPVSPASATHDSTSPSPSGSNCEWFGSVEFTRTFDQAQDGSSSKVREEGAGWSVPSTDATCRAKVHYRYFQYDTSSDGAWWKREADGTVPATYQVFWGDGGGIRVYFSGDETVPYMVSDSGGYSEVGATPAGANAGCKVPGVDTPAEEAATQAIVVTCSQYENPGPHESYIATIRMRRTVCDRTIDSDGDKLSDCREFALQTEPQNPDTDGDGLTDGAEVLTHGTHPRRSDTDGGGVPDGTEIAAGTNPNDATDDGPNPDPSPSPSPTPTPQCDTFKSQTRQWSARTPIRLLPDRHWGDFKATVDWCYDSDSNYAKITDIRSRGTVDDGPFGLFARAAGLFGFKTKWEKQECEPAQDPQCGDISSHGVRLASVTRRMAFCFNLATLLDKIGVKGWLEDRAKSKVKYKLDDYIRRHGSLSGDELDAELLGVVDELADIARGKVDRIDDVLRDRHVPNFIAEWLEDQVEDPFDGLMAKWRDEVTNQLNSDAYKDMLSDQATDAIVDPVIEWIEGFLEVCGGPDFLLPNDHPGLLTLWQPQVTVNVLADGRLDWTRIDLYKHPLMRIARV